MRKKFLDGNYFEKEVVLTIRVPNDFDEDMESRIDEALANVLFNEGCELIDSKEYRDVPKKEDNKPRLSNQIQSASTRTTATHPPVEAPKREISTIVPTEDMIKEVEKLNNNTPDGIVVDADTILVDLIDGCDYKFNGFAQDIFDIWKSTTDKKAVEQMFYEFTDMEFNEYLEKCKSEITREHEVGVLEQNGGRNMNPSLSMQIQSASTRAIEARSTFDVEVKESEHDL